MSHSEESLAQRMRDRAEEKRGRQRFGADSLPVRAAKRYCIRTGRTWEIGVGGRCELGKRAIKQWLYEAAAPVRRAWEFALAKWILVLAVVTALIIAGLVFIPGPTLTLLAICALLAVVLLGAFAGYVAADEKGAFVTMDNGDRVFFILGWTLGLPAALVAFGGTKLTRQPWWWRVKSMLRWVGLGLLVCAVIGLIGFAIYSGHGLDLLFTVGVIVGLVAAIALVVGGISLILDALNRALDGKRAKRIDLQHADADLQQRSFEQLLPHLQKLYEEQKTVASIYYSDRNPLPSFDGWIERFKVKLESNGHLWSDLLRPGIGNRANVFSYLHYEGFPAVVEPGYHDFIDAVDDMVVAAMPARARKRHHLKQAIAFVAATLFMLKSKVCPNVDLPAWDEVEA